jgi:hypothetical protein
MSEKRFVFIKLLPKQEVEKRQKAIEESERLFWEYKNQP